MSPSIIAHGDQYETFRDPELHGLLSVMAHIASLDPIRWKPVADVLATWIESARSSGNNAIDLDLNLLAPPERCACMTALMQHVEEEAPDLWPGGVPAAIGDLVRAYNPPSPWPTPHIVSASARLRGLIERAVCHEWARSLSLLSEAERKT